jgi:hypothetical protein
VKVQPFFAACARLTADGSTLIAIGLMPRVASSGRCCWKLRNSELQNGHQ